MAFILGAGSTIPDTRGPTGTKPRGCIEPTPRPCIATPSTSGRKSKPEAGPPHTTSVPFRLEIPPDDKANDSESNEPRINTGETGNTGENRKPSQTAISDPTYAESMQHIHHPTPNFTSDSMQQKP